jgi:Tol biopolymer transport system component
MGQVSHPNIVAVYDVGKEDATPYVVAELLEGETLRDALARGPMPAATSMEIGVQIARGLAAAHAKGVLHRDLKPANVFLTSDGQVKILDFGLAKLVHPEWDRLDSDHSTVSLTAPGLVMGTVSYMSPEQLEGARVDFRSDIFSFGAMLYEMVTGSRAFDGKSPASVAASILREEPRYLASDTEKIPPGLYPILRRCLDKNPDARFQSTRDLLFALEQQTRNPSRSLTSTLQFVRSAVSKPAARRAAVTTGLTLSLLATLLLTTTGPGSQARTETPAAPLPLRLARVTSSGDVGFTAGISPDGVYVAYSRRLSDRTSLWLRHIPTGSELRLVPDADWIGSARISPDRNFVYYTAGSDGSLSLYRVPLLGGEPRTLIEGGIGMFSQISFSGDGARLALVRDVDAQSTVCLVNADGSSPRTLASRNRKEWQFHSCSWSPDSARLACTLEGQQNSVMMLMIDTATGRAEERKEFFRDHYFWAHEWESTGSIVGATPMNGSAIWRVAPDGSNPQRLTNDLSGYRDISIARDTRAICATQENTSYNLWRVSIDGRTAPALVTSGFNTRDGEVGIATLPDGRFVYSSYASGKSLDIWIGNADGSGRKRLTEDDVSDERRPSASPDGRFVIYVRQSPTSETELWRVDVSGTNNRKLADGNLGTVTPDGKWIYFYRGGGSTQTQIFRMPAEGGEATPLAGRNCYGPNISPDGTSLLATCRDATNKPHTTIFRVDGSGRTLEFPPYRSHHWSPDGKSFAFIEPGKTANIWLQPLNGTSPRKLTNFADTGWNFAWSRDGQSLLVPRWQPSTDVMLLTP